MCVYVEGRGPEDQDINTKDKIYTSTYTATTRKFVTLTDNKLTIYITSIAGVNPDDNLTYQLIIEFQCQTFIQLT